MGIVVRNYRLNIKSEGYHSGITVLSLTFKVITLSRMGAVSKAVFDKEVLPSPAPNQSDLPRGGTPCNRSACRGPVVLTYYTGVGAGPY